jgi:outer membrane receptor protein involved in Fe transport
VLDATARQSFVTPIGPAYARVTLTRTFKADDQILPGTPQIERAETDVGPDRNVWTAELGWERGHFGANLFGRFSSSYRNTQSTVQSRVGSYATADLTGFYQSDNGLRINLGVLNLTDTSFPFIDSLYGSFDAQRVDPRGRIGYLEVTKSFGAR